MALAKKASSLFQSVIVSNVTELADAVAMFVVAGAKSKKAKVSNPYSIAPEHLKEIAI